MRFGTQARVKIAADDEDELEKPSLYGKTARDLDLDTRLFIRHDRYSQDHNIPNLIDSSDDVEEEQHQKDMLHLVDSDDETCRIAYKGVGSPTKEDRARERIDTRWT
jgi:hypothetical protein